MVFDARNPHGQTVRERRGPEGKINIRKTGQNKVLRWLTV